MASGIKGNFPLSALSYSSPPSLGFIILFFIWILGYGKNEDTQ
jgi:hypothetical protein